MKCIFSANFLLALWPFLMYLSQAEEVDFGSLHSCAQECINKTVTTSTCLPYSDPSCLCQNVPVLDRTKHCWFNSCSRKEHLWARNITSIVCDEPVENKSQDYSNTVSILFALACFSVVCHFAARFSAGLLKWVYDGNMFAIFFVATIMDTLSWKLAKTGLGQHIWKVSDEDITVTLRYFYFVEIEYFTIMGLIKIQFLIFYLQIFPDQTFRRLVKLVLAFQIVATLPFLVSAIFICTPISYIWTSWAGDSPGTCINNNLMVITHAGLAIFLDFVTLILPIRSVWRLQLDTNKKIGLILMFSVGACVTIVSIIRFPTMLSFATGFDLTWNYVEGSRWSHLELHIAIVCLCMPAMRLGFMRLGRWAGLISRSGTDKEGYAGTYARSGNCGFGRKDNDIHVHTSYTVNTSIKGQSNDDERSFVQLVQVERDKLSN